VKLSLRLPYLQEEIQIIKLNVEFTTNLLNTETSAAQVQGNRAIIPI